MNREYICIGCKKTYKYHYNLENHYKNTACGQKKVSKNTLEIIRKSGNVKIVIDDENIAQQYPTDEINWQTISAYRFIELKYFDAPVLKPFNFNNDDDQLMDIMLKQCNEIGLHKYLGNIIIDIYKTDDLQKRSLWCTDVSRKSFIIKASYSKWIRYMIK